MSITAGDGKLFQNISATTDSFPLKGGHYVTEVIATFGINGTVTLQRLGADGSTWFNEDLFNITDDHHQMMPAGTYRFNVNTATGVYAAIQRIQV